MISYGYILDIFTREEEYFFFFYLSSFEIVLIKIFYWKNIDFVVGIVAKI